MNVDYKNAEQFESIARSAGFHDFDVMGNGCYADDFLQHFYAGWKAWQASRKVVEGEVAGLKAEIRTERDPSDEYVSFLVFVNGGKSEPYLFIPETLEDTVLDEVVKRINTHPASADEQLIKRKQAEAVENAFMDLATSIRKERLHGISVKGLIHAAEEYATTALNTGGKSNG